jgi:tetratricopeptide (TPR) repeat protein
MRHAEAGQYEEALQAFEAAERDAPSWPASALRAWGLAASETGRPLLAYVRLRQYLARDPGTADRAAVEERVSRAQEALVTAASRFSRVVAWTERRPDVDSAGERHLARLAAREGEVSAEGLSGIRIDAPLWRRAEEIPIGPYLDLVRRLLELPAVVEDVPAQAFDPNAPGPRRAAVVRLVIGDEERKLEALRDEPYQRLAGVVARIMDFVRTVPAVPSEPPDTPPPAPPAPARKPLRKGR